MSKPIRITNSQKLSKPTSTIPKQPSHRLHTRRPGFQFDDTWLSESLFTVTEAELSLTLPIPPSINHQYATVNGRRILSSKGRQYKSAVAQQVLSALTTSSNKRALLDNFQSHSLIFSVWFYFSSALRRDLDGGLKIAQDAICNALDLNDNRIGEIHLYRGIDAKSPRIECTLSIQASAPLPRKKKKRDNSSKQFSRNRYSPRIPKP